MSDPCGIPLRWPRCKELLRWWKEGSANFCLGENKHELAMVNKWCLFWTHEKHDKYLIFDMVVYYGTFYWFQDHDHLQRT